MDARLTPSVAVPACSHPLAETGRVVLPAIVGVMTLAGMWLLSRRLTGAFAEPLEPVQLIVAGAAMSAFGMLIRVVSLHTISDSAFPRTARMVVGLPTAAILMAAASLSLPGSASWALLLFWALLLAGEGVALRPMLRHLWPGGPFRPTDQVVGQNLPVSGSESPWSETELLVPPAATHSGFTIPGDIPSSPAGEVVQQLTRVRQQDGTDMVFGVLRGEFASRQRSLSLHVAFCPPMESMPELLAEQLEGPTVRIRTIQVLPYGARLDLRLQSVGRQAQWVLLEFQASAPANGRVVSP